MASSTVILRWVERYMMTVTDSHGHSVVVGRSPEPGQEWAGVKPSELLLMAVASCSAYDIVEILTKQREPLEDLKVICTGEQLAEQPYNFTHIHIRYLVKGQVNPEKLARAIQLSEERYCSVINSLRPTVQFTNEYEIF